MGDPVNTSEVKNKMLLSFKTELKPNNRQIMQFRQHCGVARHAYNFGGNSIVLDVLKQRETDKSVKIPSAMAYAPLRYDLHRRLIAEIKPSNPWYYESSKASPQQALAEVRTAWDRCFKKVSAQPKFKKISSTEIACGADKPLKSHLETALKQEVSIETTDVQLSLDKG